MADVATPETDQELREAGLGKACTRCVNWPGRPVPGPRPPAFGTSDHDRRYHVRFNEQCRTMTVQLPPASFAETRSCLEARARRVPTDGETPWDQRLCDGFLELIRSSTCDAAGQATASSPQFVVVHVPLDTLVDEAGEPTVATAGEARGRRA